MVSRSDCATRANHWITQDATTNPQANQIPKIWARVLFVTAKMTAKTAKSPLAMSGMTGILF